MRIAHGAGGAFAYGVMLADFETPSRAKMPKVWGRRSSFNVQKVMWLIGELELAHQHFDAGGTF
jgi:hypothetical protein